MTGFSVLVGDPYKTCDDGDVICVTTNAEVKVNGRAVMGRGCAKFVADNFKDIDKKLADFLLKYGNRVFNLGVNEYKGKKIRIVSFPTKNMWRDNSSLELISASAKQLVELANKMGFEKVYVPIPGCSNGKLRWSRVKLELACLDDRFIVYSLEQHLFNM